MQLLPKFAIAIVFVTICYSHASAQPTTQQELTFTQTQTQNQNRHELQGPSLRKNTRATGWQNSDTFRTQENEAEFGLDTRAEEQPVHPAPQEEASARHSINRSKTATAVWWVFLPMILLTLTSWGCLYLFIEGREKDTVGKEGESRQQRTRQRGQKPNLTKSTLASSPVGNSAESDTEEDIRITTGEKTVNPVDPASVTLRKSKRLSKQSKNETRSSQIAPINQRAFDQDYEIVLDANEIDPREATVGSTTADDLTRIRGIGPASQKVLRQNGIQTFEQIAQMSPAELDRIFEQQKNRFSMLDVTTWPNQAKTFADSQQVMSEEETLLNEVNEMREIASNATMPTDAPANANTKQTKQQHT